MGNRIFSNWQIKLKKYCKSKQFNTSLIIFTGIVFIKRIKCSVELKSTTDLCKDTLGKLALFT